MPSPAQGLIYPVRTVVLAAVTALLITLAALPTPAQNSIPPTAVQAAKMPQFASRLAHPAPRPPSTPNPVLARQGSRRTPGGGGNDIYDNGPINGNTDAWSINFGFVTSDTITVGGGSSVNGMTFGAWLFPGDTLTSAEVSITSSPNGGTSYFDQTVNFTQQGGCTGNQFGYNVCTETATFTGPVLSAGTYWVNLQNASVPSGDPVYWDENSGAGCESSGCPSQAYSNSVGTIPSEAFTMDGSAGSPACFESGGNLRVLSNFTQQQAGPYGQDGVTIDRAGNLYGAFPVGGNDGAGFAFKLAHRAGWLLDPLFNFFGGSSAGQPTGLIVGANGSLYGGAQGGIQNCGTNGSQYCGLVYNLTPLPTACATALCSWNENVLYRFSSESDGSGVINVSASDEEGNLYGTTTTGGADGAGTVFELTPSGRSWTKTILHNFTGGSDASPNQVLVGNDGNLYGAATGAYPSNGIVFQLTPSGGQWTESILHLFQSAEGSIPAYLVQDSASNLYGITNSSQAPIFTLQKTGSGWVFSEHLSQHSCQPEDLPYDFLNNLAIDAAGNLYGTGAGGEGDLGGSGKKLPGDPGCHYSYIFKASYASDGWHYQDLDFLLNTVFPTGGSLALDTSGNLYGTTIACGTSSYGTVWQFAP